jgi:hypothetical protein
MNTHAIAGVMNARHRRSFEDVRACGGGDLHQAAARLERVELCVASSADCPAPRDCRDGSERARRQPVTFEAHPLPDLPFRAEPADRVSGGGEVDGVAIDEIARDAMPSQSRGEISHRLLTELPDPLAGGAAVAPSQLGQALVGLLEQQCGAGDRTATTDALAFQHGHRDTFRRERLSDECPRDSAADNHHVARASPAQRWITSRGFAFPFSKPDGLTSSQSRRESASSWPTVCFDDGIMARHSTPYAGTLPYWSDSASISTFTKLDRDLDVDVVVVGGGITGLTTAYLLATAGQSVALLERDRCGRWIPAIPPRT